MAQRCYVVYIGRVPGVYEQWQDCHMQVNGFPGNRYKGYMSRVVAEENWRNHLRQKNRPGIKDNVGSQSHHPFGRVDSLEKSY